MELTHEHNGNGYELAKIPSSGNWHHHSEAAFRDFYQLNLGVLVAFKGKRGQYISLFKDVDAAANQLRRWYGVGYERYLMGSRPLAVRDDMVYKDRSNVGTAIRPYERTVINGKTYDLVPHDGTEGEYLLREVSRWSL